MASFYTSITSDSTLYIITNIFTITDLNSEANSAKIIAVNKIVQYAASRKEKVVIFTKFIGSLDIIEKFLPKGIKSIKLSGKTTERESSIKRFHSDADITVLLLSIKAYGHGLNLTCANHLILAEHDWNPTYEVQAAMRIYRKGQTKNTYIYRLVTSNTYDEKMYSVGVKKEGLSKAVLDQMNGKPVKLNEVGVWRIYDNEDNPNIKYTQPTNDVFREIVRQLGDYLKGIAEHEEILGLNSI